MKCEFSSQTPGDFVQVYSFTCFIYLYAIKKKAVCGYLCCPLHQLYPSAILVKSDRTEEPDPVVRQWLGTLQAHIYFLFHKMKKVT